MLNILFVGDIVGKIGRKTIAKIIPGLRRDLKLDLVVANAENAAHGAGVTEDSLKELLAAGIDYFTSGDHAFDRIKQAEACYEKLPIIRPANYPPGVPGRGYAIIPSAKGNILLINLIGRVFMPMDYDCPFRKFDEILANPDLASQKFSAILVDMHAEATAEKVSLGLYIDGRASACFGTHTHIQTADEKITDNGTACITDAGMVGYSDGSLGLDKDNIIKTALMQVKHPHVVPETGRTVLNAVLVRINEKTAQAKTVKRIAKSLNIK